MDPIKRKFGAEPPRIGADQPVSPSPGVPRTFRADPVPILPPPVGAATVQPNFDRACAQIRQGLQQSRSRQEILQDMVDSELRLCYGQRATPAMRQAITESFSRDPHLADLFNQLFGKAASTNDASQ